MNEIEELSESISPINQKPIDQYQWKEPSLMAKYYKSIHKTSYFHGGSIINMSLITCNDNIVIPLITQIYVLHWYHIYLLHTGIYRTEVMIFQHFYCLVIRNDFQK